jgi:hypothetical protein
MQDVPSARGRVLLLLEGGYSPAQTAEGIAHCLHALLHHSGAPLAASSSSSSSSSSGGSTIAAIDNKLSLEVPVPRGVKPQTVAAVESVRAAHARYWPCLAQTEA